MIYKIFIFLILLALCLAVQSEGVLAAYGVAPNIVLMFFLALVAARFSFRIAFVYLAVLLLVVFAWMPFWIWEYVALCGVIILCLFCRRFLTGNRFFDFFILGTVGTLIYDLILYFSSVGTFFVKEFFIELIYNLLIGIVFWEVFQKYGIPEKT